MPGILLAAVCEPAPTQENTAVKVIGWIIGIIFLIGLLVVIGVFDLIF
jgi:hypothetical protein